MDLSPTRAAQLRIRDAELAAELKRHAATGKTLRDERKSIQAQLDAAPTDDDAGTDDNSE